MGVYRTLQEQIKNIIKHSKATKATIDILIIHNNLVITIKDNGVGFMAVNLENNKGIGLRNMKSRIDYLGGNLLFNDKAKIGTELKITISI